MKNNEVSDAALLCIGAGCLVALLLLPICSARANPVIDKALACGGDMPLVE